MEGFGEPFRYPEIRRRSTIRIRHFGQTFSKMLFQPGYTPPSMLYYFIRASRLRQTLYQVGTVAATTAQGMCMGGVWRGGTNRGGALIWGGTCDRFRLEDSQRTPFGTVLLYERIHPSVHNRKRIAGSSFTSSSRQCLYLLWLSATVNNLEGGFPIPVL